MFKIVGLFLIKNEDIFIKQAVLNILDFCDEIYIEDNYSTDKTFEIITELANQHSKINVSRIESPLDSHRHINKYCNTKTWIFGVDGDELYDKERLAKFRTELQEGKYSDQWIVFGNVLHCIELDRKNNLAKGYLCPPAKSMTKLYNFSIITGWREITERLHGYANYLEGYHAELRYALYEEYSWENSPFRCLHTAFVKRSSKSNNKKVIRVGPVEAHWEKLNNLSFYKRVRFKIISLISLLFKKHYKYKDYMQGNIVEKDVNSFFE